jgi:hypothetical protein
MSTPEQETQGIEQAEPARQTVPESATTEQEERDFRAAHQADRPPTSEEEAAAEAHGRPDDDVVAHEREMTRRGAEAKGEGHIP